MRRSEAQDGTQTHTCYVEPPLVAEAPIDDEKGLDREQPRKKCQICPDIDHGVGQARWNLGSRSEKVGPYRDEKSGDKGRVEPLGAPQHERQESRLLSENDSVD